MGTSNFDTIFFQVFNLCYQNLGLISLTVCKLCTFWQRSISGKFQQFFHHNFRLKWKFWIMMISPERSSSYLSEYTLFQIFKIYYYLQKLIFRWKLKIVSFFCIFFFLNYFQIYQTISIYYLKNMYEFDKKRNVSSEKNKKFR